MPPLPHPPIHSPPGSPVPDEDFVVLHRPPTPAPSSPSPPFIRRSSGSVLLPSRANAPPSPAAAIAPYAFSAPIPILVTRGVTPDACLEQEILPRSSHGYHNPGAPIRLLPFLDRPPHRPNGLASIRFLEFFLETDRIPSLADIGNLYSFHSLTMTMKYSIPIAKTTPEYPQNVSTVGNLHLSTSLYNSTKNWVLLLQPIC